MVKMAVFGLQNDQNWFHAKSERQKNPDISHCVFSMRLPMFLKELKILDVKNFIKIESKCWIFNSSEKVV